MGEAAKKQEKTKYELVADKYRHPEKKVGNEWFVLDGDRHLIEPLEAFTKYLDPEFKKQAPTIKVDNGGGIRFVIEDRMYQKPTGRGLGRPEGNSDYRPRGESLTQEEAILHCWENRDEDMDVAGVDIGMWIPTAGLFVPDVVDINLQWALMRALNDWTGKDFANSDRHMWCGSFPLNPEYAVQEAKRCKELGATAMWMRPNIMHEIYWWDEEWEPFWSTLEDLDMPLLFHEATGTYNATYSTDYKYDVYWMAHVASHPLEMCTALIGIIGYGILQRHPKLKVMMCEAGVTWVPYFIGRMDEHVDSRPAHEVNLDKLPSEYFKEQVCICAFEDDEPLLKETMALMPGNVGYTSDFRTGIPAASAALCAISKSFPISTSIRATNFSRIT